MPVVSVKSSRLFHKLGRSYTEEEFQELCFQFGIELDEVTSERKMKMKEREGAAGGAKLDKKVLQELEQYSDEEIYKIEIPANRYDLLCEEGIVRALRIFLQLEKTPKFSVKNPSQLLVMNVKKETKQIRPFVVCAVLRNVKMDQAIFDSLIDLQDKLHQNICRKRTLVAIGTHDLSHISGPFSYEALPPKNIKFVALTQTEEHTAAELMEIYETNEKFKHLKPYVPIIKDSPVYPVIYDSKRVVLSLPPIINGDYSKITLDTKDIFIECTATDKTKANIVLNTIVTMFSEHCKDPFTVEQVKVVYPDGTADITPDLSEHEFNCPVDYINSRIGVNLNVNQICELLEKMQLRAEKKDANNISVKAPPTRSDILHACDIMEDVGIAYGYNNIVRTTPNSSTVGKQDPLNQLTDHLRLELGMAGFTETLTLILCAHKENFELMKKQDDKTAVVIANPKTIEFQTCRVSLIPGLLKTLHHNVKIGLPIKLFEINDVVLVDDKKDVGARNVRKLAALFCSFSSGLEIIHGLLDRLMETIGIPCDEKEGYSIKPCNDESYFPGRQASILLTGKEIGKFGIVHPDVLDGFGIKYPCSVLEFDVEPFL
jgi:phenylalanyl-tRNA synthetase beta chain